MCLKSSCREVGWLEPSLRNFERFGDDIFLCRKHFWRKRFDDLGIGVSKNLTEESYRRQSKRKKRKQRVKQPRKLRIIASRFCKICGGPHHGRGYCTKHYHQVRVHENRDGTEENFIPYELRPKSKPEPKIIASRFCKICGGPHKARDFCDKHLQRLRRFEKANGTEQEFSASGGNVFHRIPEGSTCQEDGCDLPERCKGRCNKHYTAYLRRKRKDRQKIAAK